MDIVTPSPTPPLPKRRHPPWSPFTRLPASASTAGLVPAPLFSKVKPLVLHVTVHDLPSPPEEPESPCSSQSPPASLHSSTDSTASSPANSAPSSPANRPRSLAYEQPPPPYSARCNVMNVSGPRSLPAWREASPVQTSSLPIRRLRRRPSPKKESLRTLRVKESEACLQRAYEERLEAYLNGEMFARVKWRDDLERVVE